MRGSPEGLPLLHPVADPEGGAQRKELELVAGVCDETKLVRTGAIPPEIVCNSLQGISSSWLVPIFVF